MENGSSHAITSDSGLRLRKHRYHRDFRASTQSDSQFFLDRATNNGLTAGPNSDNGIGSGPRRLNLSPTDITALVDFLATLTEEALASDAKYNNPFKTM